MCLNICNTFVQWEFSRFCLFQNESLLTYNIVSIAALIRRNTKCLRYNDVHLSFSILNSFSKCCYNTFMVMAGSLNKVQIKYLEILYNHSTRLRRDGIFLFNKLFFIALILHLWVPAELKLILYKGLRWGLSWIQTFYSNTKLLTF